MPQITDLNVPPLKNSLLAALPVEVQERLFPFMSLVKLPLGQVMY